MTLWFHTQLKNEFLKTVMLVTGNHRNAGNGIFCVDLDLLKLDEINLKLFQHFCNMVSNYEHFHRFKF